jgi:beta-lactamase regulating signal transducer with metallopeptidase domain/predicted  nucleic acid-binding Zn-ribbon protein
MDAMLLLKASLLLSVTLLAARLLQRAPAATRHRLWSLAFAALLALPLLASALPALSVPVPAGWRAPIFLPRPPEAARARDVLGSNPTQPEAVTIADGPAASRAPLPAAHENPGATPWPTIIALLVASWLTGTAAAAGALLLSLFRVRRLARTADEMDDAAWRIDADTLGSRLGLRRRARLLVSRGVRTPMAGGIWRPVIFLPPSARAWQADCRHVVLAHELAHLAGRDPLRHLAARLAVALYWFHPLAWMAAKQSSVAREQACDAAVLALGTRPSAYAQVLLDLADVMHPSAPALAALPMVERSLLERRLTAILNGDLRPATRRRLLMPAIGVALLTISVAAAQPAGSTSANVPGLATMAGATAPAKMANPPSTANAAATAGGATTAQPGIVRDSACSWDVSDGSTFSGTMSTSRSGGRTIVSEQIGTRGADRVIQESFGDLQICMRAEGVGTIETAERPSQWLGRARRVVMEARRGRTVQQLDVEPGAGGAPRILWRVGSTERAFDAAAQHWRDRMLAALDTIWELSNLRGEVSTLHGEISSIRGELSSLQGEISALRGEVSSMDGRASSIRGDESTLHGEISSIQGHVSSLRGAISSEQGAISSLDASRYGADASERARIAASIDKHDAEIARIERQIRDYDADAKVAAVEQEIKVLNADAKVAAIDTQIRAFDLDGKIRDVERRIAALDVDGKVAATERQIASLDADRRGRQLEERRDSEMKQLEAAIAAVR